MISPSQFIDLFPGTTMEEYCFALEMMQLADISTPMRAAMFLSSVQPRDCWFDAAQAWSEHGFNILADLEEISARLNVDRPGTTFRRENLHEVFPPMAGSLIERMRRFEYVLDRW